MQQNREWFNILVPVYQGFPGNWLLECCIDRLIVTVSYVLL